jgi:hypothetical protein
MNGAAARVSAGGGATKPLFTPEAQSARQTWPAVLPGTDRVLYLSRPPGDSRQELRIGSAADGTSRSVLRSDSMGVFAGPHTLLFARNDVLFAQSFDADRSALVGDPVRVLPGVSVKTQNGRGGFDASGERHHRGAVRERRRRAGQALGPALSPDGTRVAFHRMGGGRR